MNDLNLFMKISMLPEPLKVNVLEYIDSIVSKKTKSEKLSVKHPKAGCMKGTFEMAPDFEEPLEDFNEYM
jgi:hypothetical protein